ncbi:hypothetical protein [Thaumasiovibrio sp. DFM-14]|uniref:hypothetical protein n=1 Tax=Thaumasiovibrio sp. DFM-14 TaxID=3384792 RepID=UPI0039A0F196
MSWLVNINGEALNNEFILGEAVKARGLTVTPRGTLDGALATVANREVTARAIRPLPVCNVRLNGVYDPDSITLPLTIEWSHRNRLSQVGTPEDLTSWYTEGGMEAGVESVIHIEDQDGDLLHMQQGTFTSYKLEKVEGLERLSTIRDGHESYMVARYDLTID